MGLGCIAWQLLLGPQKLGSPRVVHKTSLSSKRWSQESIETPQISRASNPEPRPRALKPKLTQFGHESKHWVCNECAWAAIPRHKLVPEFPAGQQTTLQKASFVGISAASMCDKDM